MKRSKEIVGWCLFDVANSSYTTIIITVFFSRILAEVIVGPDEGTTDRYQYGNLLWSILLSISWGITAILGPFFGALADVSAHRKRLLSFSVGLCVVFSLLMYFIPLRGIFLAGLFLVLSNIGFCLSENFISAFLPHIADEKDMGKISGWGWGIGYFGGIASIAICQFLVVGDVAYTVENYDRLRLVGPATALFFLLFSIPTFLWVREPKVSAGAQRSVWSVLKSSYVDLKTTFQKLTEYPDLARFLIGLFFASGGLAIVISFTSIYAAQEVGIDGAYLVYYFITLNVAAAIGAIAFGYVQDKIGNLLSINLTLVIWVLSIILIHQLSNIGQLFGVEDLRALFLAIGVLPGFCLGATQAAARALVGLFAPQKNSAEFFGFWGFSAKLAGVFSIIAFGMMQSLFSLRGALLFCSLFFTLALLLNFTVQEQRGREAALRS